MARRKGNDINGWLILDKPQGLTSNQALGRLKRLFNPKKLGHAGTLLVVTSPYHVYRTRLIFSDHLPASRILVVASREEPLPTRWWTDREAATNVALELGKLVFYSLGLSFT